MKKTVLWYGFYGAATLCTLMLLAWYLGQNLELSTQEVIGYASIVVSLSFIYFGIKHFRDHENVQEITFKKGLLIGILISLITALAFGILDVIYVKFLNPDFMTDYYANYTEQMRTSLPPGEFEQKLTQLESEKDMFANPVFNFMAMFLIVFVIGFVISLISALLLQRKNQ